jgi:hypothetical protein
MRTMLLFCTGVLGLGLSWTAWASARWPTLRASRAAALTYLPCSDRTGTRARRKPSMLMGLQSPRSRSAAWQSAP